MPRKGDIAVCSHGYIGLILKDASIPNTSPNGVVEAELWTGIHLTTKGGKQIGAAWQSRRPTVLCSISDVLAAAGDYVPALVEHLRASGVPPLVAIETVSLAPQILRDLDYLDSLPPRYVRPEVDGLFDDDVAPYNGD